MRRFCLKLLALQNYLILEGRLMIEKKQKITGNSSIAVIQFSDKDIADSACLTVMSEYNNIFTVIDNLGDKINPHAERNPVDIAQILVSCCQDNMKFLFSLNRRSRLFYLFKIHELISFINTTVSDWLQQIIDIINASMGNSSLEITCLLHDTIGNLFDGENILLYKFDTLLNRLNDFDIYKRLFVCDIISNNYKLMKQLSILTNIPCDVIKSILSYCHLSIHNAFDLNLIFEKLHSLDKKFLFQ